ncbi:hypothetical protein [Sedimenticola selenatireducens]|uniref:RRM domain-containing protein n=1 Tax=Sedimenticola selenatireducens TaxID=191960 RepID=A0A558DIQ8_9GAMM|nr:hypothetical protein [Sedimenticola selenatireducens]TVO69007.1 hypothetical protein FHP88_18105 [Sedimenticola selenatireducens]TVT60891.1 MAG: hypothetical protein FHK78_18590 [Sedimenticola selenatireducens]
MKIFIPYVPNGIQRQDLLALVQKAIKPSWFFPFGSGATVAKCNLIRILDVDTGGIEYHGLIDVYPEKAATKVIRHLDGKELNGQKISARNWVDRTLIIGGRKNLPEGIHACKRRRNLEISVA